MFNIPVEKYLENALQLTPEEKALVTSFAEWMPDDIIDCHAHSNRAEDVESISTKALGHMLSTFPYFSIEDSMRINGILHPKKRIRTLRFPKTFRGINHRDANAYLLTKSPADDRIALFGLPEDAQYTISKLAHPRVSALKMYYSYVEPTATRIYKVFTREILEQAQALNIPLVLHLPKMIVHSIDDLEMMLTDFPRLRVAIAHLGLSKMLVPGLREAFERIKRYAGLSLDTSLNPSTGVVSLALEVFGTSRIMYGSDAPLHLIRSVPYQHPEKGQRIATEYLYHWSDPEDHRRFGHLAAQSTHAHWLCLKAIRAAIDAMPVSEQSPAKERVFRLNAESFYGF